MKEILGQLVVKDENFEENVTMEENTEYPPPPDLEEQQSVYVTKDHLMVMALSSVWGQEERALQAMAVHIYGEDVEIVSSLLESVKDPENSFNHSFAVVEIMVHFPGLNIVNQYYIAIISKTYFLISKCSLGIKCLHYQWFMSHFRVEESYQMDLQFGISILGLFDAVKSRVSDFTLQDLQSILREANVFFSPVSQIQPKNYCMIPTPSSGGASFHPHESPSCRSAPERKRKRSSTLSQQDNFHPKISLVGLFNSPTVMPPSQMKPSSLEKEGSNMGEELDHKPVELGGTHSSRVSVEMEKPEDKPIPLEDIHRRIGQCESKYTYYGTHDNIIEEEDPSDSPLQYDNNGMVQLSDHQKETLDRIVRTVGISQNSWKYCCQIFFKKFHRLQPMGSKKYEKNVLEVYMKMQYFASLKKSYIVGDFSEIELTCIKFLYKSFWANSTLICNHFSYRSQERICKEMEKLAKSPVQVLSSSCFLVSLRIIPRHLDKEDRRRLENLQQEISCLVCGDASAIFLLPCNNSSIICPHRTYSKVGEVQYYTDFGDCQDSDFEKFLQKTAEEHLGNSSTSPPPYRGQNLTDLIRQARLNLYKLPVKTLFRLNGMKRLKDAQFVIENFDT